MREVGKGLSQRQLWSAPDAGEGGSEGGETWKRTGSSSSWPPAANPHPTTAAEASLSPLLCSFILISFDCSQPIPKTVDDATVRHRNAQGNLFVQHFYRSFCIL